LTTACFLVVCCGYFQFISPQIQVLLQVSGIANSDNIDWFIQIFLIAE